MAHMDKGCNNLISLQLLKNDSVVDKDGMMVDPSAHPQHMNVLIHLANN